MQVRYSITKLLTVTHTKCCRKEGIVKASITAPNSLLFSESDLPSYCPPSLPSSPSPNCGNFISNKSRNPYSRTLDTEHNFSFGSINTSHSQSNHQPSTPNTPIYSTIHYLSAPAPGPTPPPMPSRSGRGAPTFDAAQPRELARFFSDLEFLFTKCSITVDDEKIKAAVRRLSMAGSDVWMAVPACDATPANWTDFKDPVIKLYPTASDSLDTLVGVYLQLGIVTASNLTEYTRNFHRIAGS